MKGLFLIFSFFSFLFSWRRFILFFLSHVYTVSSSNFFPTLAHISISATDSLDNEICKHMRTPNIEREKLRENRSYVGQGFFSSYVAVVYRCVGKYTFYPRAPRVTFVSSPRKREIQTRCSSYTLVV